MNSIPRANVEQHYWELRLACHPEASEALTNYLWEVGALGVVEEERLRAFFPAVRSPETICQHLVTYLHSLQTLGLPGTLGPIEVLKLNDSAWEKAWQVHFRPVRVGRVWIVPPWERVSAGVGECVIQISPGRAFGTGQHETTQGCLQLLDTLLTGAPPARALDIGTGTGILAIAAVALGVPQCLAIDIDPDAVAAARENVDLNQVDRHVRVVLASPDSLGEPPFTLILANLLTDTHRPFFSVYDRLLAPGGQAILGGILAPETDQMAALLAAFGFRIAERIAGEEWCALRAERR